MNDNVYINQAGIVNAGWEDCAVYFIGVPSKGEVYYIGQAKNLSKRTGYSVSVENYKCINANSGRFPLVVFTDAVNSTLMSISSELPKDKFKLLDAIEMGGIRLFDTINNGGNRSMKSLSYTSIMFGAAIIILSRKYNIIESIKRASLLCNSLYNRGRCSEIDKKDSTELVNLKSEYNNISKRFFDSLSKGNFYVQQGLDRSYYSFEYRGLIQTINDISIFSGDYKEFCELLEKENIKYVDLKFNAHKGEIHLFNDIRDNKKIILIIKSSGEDLIIETSSIRDFCMKNNILSDDIISIIDKNINFVPII